MAAKAMAMVGTWVGLVQPGSLSFVQVVRAIRTRLALSTSVWVAEVLAAMDALRLTWLCMWAWWCW
jgi:hypothetical protein